MRGGFLLDTNASLWLSTGQLAPDLKARLDEAIVADIPVYLSPFTAWEIAGLVSRGRLSVSIEPRRWFAKLIEQGATLAPLTPDILIEAWSLPQLMTRDPADRILAATARALNCPLITRDRKLLDYADAGWMKAVAC